MAARLVVPNDFDDLLLCDNTEDMIDEKDLKSFEKERETMANTKSAQQALRLDWLSWQAAERKRRPAALQTAVPVYKGLDDHELLQDFHRMSKEEAQAFFLAVIRVYRDGKNLRWQAYFPEVGSKSRSFSVYTPAGALKKVLQWAWSERLLKDGFATSAWPVKNVFEEPPWPSSSSVASGSAGQAPAASSSGS